MKEHFCTCPDKTCAMNPANHDKGCDPCVRSNLAQKRMPTCFFIAVHDDLSGVSDYTIEGFVDFFQQHREEYMKRKE